MAQSIAQTPEALDRLADQQMKKAGWIWTAANGFLIAKGGLSSDPILATSGVTTTLASGSNAVFGDSANRFSGPAFLASTTAYAGENFRNAVTNNPNPLSDSAEAAFGVGVTAGVAVLFYGQEIKKFLEKSSPVERLMKKLPQVDQGTLAKGLLYLAYTVEVARGISSVITGVRTGDAREV